MPDHLMLTVSQLFIYPIKSLGGIPFATARVTDRGLEHDRRWMLVDDQNTFLTQRKFSQMALLQVSMVESGLQVHHKLTGEQITIPFLPNTTERTTAQIWDDQCEVIFVDPLVDEWFSDALGQKCRLAFMPDTTHRHVEESYARQQDITSLSDDFPLLMIGQSSLDELNSKLEEPVTMDRFRPNIVFTGGTPFQEDVMRSFTINEVQFFVVKPCARCVVTTINQQNGIKGKEPLKTLATFRSTNGKIYFGQNLLMHGTGVVNTGDQIILSEA